MITSTRLQRRQNSVLSRSYLVYRALWPMIDDAIREARARCPKSNEPSVLDVGCGEKPYADLFDNCHYVGLNYGTDAASPDVVGDAQSLPFADCSFDIVFSTQVIEHVRKPTNLVSEAHRTLKSGGVLILTGPFYWPLHEEPHDFFRFTKYGFESLLSEAGFQVNSVKPDTGAITQVAVSLIEVLPRALLPLMPIINVVTPWLQRFSQNEKSTLNYIAIATKP
jgi:SAM-dependent methyltransferase